MPTLRQDQIEDLGTLLYKQRRHIHGGEPGTGKTPTICVLQKGIHQLHGFKSVWLMPMKLIEKNYDEAMLWGQWAPGEVAIVDNAVALGTQLPQRKLMRKPRAAAMPRRCFSP